MKTSYLFYLRSESGHPKQSFLDIVSRVGTVLDSGTSTAKDPSATWVELRFLGRTIAEVRSALGCYSSRVVEIVEISRHQGKVQAKQLDLLQGLR